MARKNRTGTVLTAREVRNLYPGLAEPGVYGDEEPFDHSEIVAPEYISRPCGCVTSACPACRPLWFDADGKWTPQRRGLYGAVVGWEG